MSVANLIEPGTYTVEGSQLNIGNNLNVLRVLEITRVLQGIEWTGTNSVRFPTPELAQAVFGALTQDVQLVSGELEE